MKNQYEEDWEYLGLLPKPTNPKEMAEKISQGKISKFISENTLLNQIWIMDPKKKVSDILREKKIEKEIKILNFIRYKVGEGV